MSYQESPFLNDSQVLESSQYYYREGFVGGPSALEVNVELGPLYGANKESSPSSSPEPYNTPIPQSDLISDEDLFALIASTVSMVVTILQECSYLFFPTESQSSVEDISSTYFLALGGPMLLMNTTLASVCQRRRGVRCFWLFSMGPRAIDSTERPELSSWALRPELPSAPQLPHGLKHLVPDTSTTSQNVEMLHYELCECKHLLVDLQFKLTDVVMAHYLRESLEDHVRGVQACLTLLADCVEEVLPKDSFEDAVETTEKGPSEDEWEAYMEAHPDQWDSAFEHHDGLESPSTSIEECDCNVHNSMRANFEF